MVIIVLILVVICIIILKFDIVIDEDDKFKFEIGILDSCIVGLLCDKGIIIVVNLNVFDEEVDSKINMNVVYYEVCVFGFKGWENVIDENGELLEYKIVKWNKGGIFYVVCDLECLKCIFNVVI